MIDKIKDFLMPTKFKIIIFLIIFVIVEIILFNVFLNYQYSLHLFYCLSIGCPTPPSIALNRLGPWLIPSLIFSYLFSCTITILFKKIIRGK
jgi:hypothetical protein